MGGKRETTSCPEEKSNRRMAETNKKAKFLPDGAASLAPSALFSGDAGVRVGHFFFKQIEEQRTLTVARKSNCLETHPARNQNKAEK